MGANLFTYNTGLEHLYINGVPIIETEILISDVFKKVARMSSLAVMADPYFNKHTNAQKLFSELHGEGDRLTKSLLEEGAREILPVFQPLQRWIPEGVYNVKNVDYSYTGRTGNFSWTNPKAPGVNTVLSIKVCCTKGNGTVTFYANYIELGSVTLPTVSGYDGAYLSYDLSGWLGGTGVSFINYCYLQNLRNTNVPSFIEARVTDASSDFEYNVIISTIEYDGITWTKALATANDVKIPVVRENIVVNYLHKSFSWENINNLKVYGVTLNKLDGNAMATINTNLGTGTQRYIGSTSVGEDYSTELTDITGVEIIIDDATDNFQYSLIIQVGVPSVVPSPRFEFDSSWNAGKIIFRWQNMDSRPAEYKLDYTSATYFDTRIDTNNFENVKKYLQEALEDYVLRELYRAIGYDKKYMDYMKSYELNRQYVKFWATNDTSLLR